MDNRLLAACTALLLAGCAKSSRLFTKTLPADGITTLQARVDRGDLSLLGIGGDTFNLAGTSTGYGSTPVRAAQHESGNAVDLSANGSQAVLTATSAYRRAWTTLNLSTPAQIDLDLQVDHGSVDAEQIDGNHTIVADRITAVHLSGSVDLTANSGGMDVDVWPAADGHVQIDSVAGDVVLRLPLGLPYDVQVIGDPSYGMQIEDLGFQGSLSQPGFFSGTVGDGSIPVMVYVNGGSFELLQSL